MTIARKPVALIAMAIAVPLGLSACQAEQPAPAKGKADGEVLEGSLSDAMLPLDTVRSQPPLAPRAAASGSKDSETAPQSDARPQPGAAASAPPPAAAAPAAAKPAAE